MLNELKRVAKGIAATFGSNCEVVIHDVTGKGTDSTIVVELTQLQTGELRVGTASIQVNWINEDGVRKATNIVAKPIGENLLQREIEYGVDPDEEETNGQE